MQGVPVSEGDCASGGQRVILQQFEDQVHRRLSNANLNGVFLQLSGSGQGSSRAPFLDFEKRCLGLTGGTDSLPVLKNAVVQYYP